MYCVLLNATKPSYFKVRFCVFIVEMTVFSYKKQKIHGKVNFFLAVQ